MDEKELKQKFNEFAAQMGFKVVKKGGGKGSGRAIRWPFKATASVSKEVGDRLLKVMQICIQKTGKEWSIADVIRGALSSFVANSGNQDLEMMAEWVISLTPNKK